MLVSAFFALAVAPFGSTHGVSVQRAEPSATPDLRPADATPAPAPYPEPPGIDPIDGEAPPQTVAIEPNGAVVGRLVQEKWVAEMTFDAREGELSLFELTAWGFARGWTSDSSMVVRDAAGVELARSERDGGTVYQDLLPFVAPSSGSYSLELIAAESGFRYLVVRHSNYEVLDEGEALDAAERDVVHGWLERERDLRTYRVTAPPGARLVLRAEPSSARGVKQMRGLRRRAAKTGGGGSRERAGMRAAMAARGAGDDSFPVLQVAAKGATVLGGDGHTQVVTVPESGTFEATIAKANAGPGGLFDLFIERDLSFAPIAIRVGDEDDEPLPGAIVTLWREPSIDPLARATMGDDGTAVVEVPPGAYLVSYRMEGGKTASLRTRLAEGSPLNLVASPD